MPFPEAAGAVNTYPIATLGQAKNSTLAGKFVDLVTGPTARDSRGGRFRQALMWQARGVDFPRPDPDAPHLADVVPAVLTAMGVPGFQSRITMAGPLAGACVLLIDGLGAELLDRYSADAPVMAELRGPTLQVGFPATTAAGLAAIGHGLRLRRPRPGRLLLPPARRRGDQCVALAAAPVG